MKVRIIPMSLEDEEFKGKSIEDVQKDFFENYMKNEGKGWYQYAKSGLEANSDDLILFQMDNKIIASAILDQVLKYRKPTVDGNYGAYVFDVKTIKTFDPITKEELSKYINGFSSFNQVKQKFNDKDVNFDLLNKRMG